jgi:hypothetical protein
MKVIANTVRNEIVKKRIPIIKSSSTFDSEVSLPVSKEELYTMPKVTPKNDQRLICFMKTKQQVLNSTKSFPILFFLFE